MTWAKLSDVQKENQKEYMKEYRKKHKEYFKKYLEKYHKEHKEQIKRRQDYYRWVYRRLKRGLLCVKCGRNSDLCFHHPNPREKLINIGSVGIHPIKIINEIKKCVILCRGCHTGVHNSLRSNEVLVNKEGE